MPKKTYLDDDTAFYNSEDDYVDCGSEESEQIGGETRGEEELDPDSDHLDRDPDDEKPDNLEADEEEEYNPVENEELVDPDEEKDIEEMEEEVEGELIVEEEFPEEEEVGETKVCHMKNLKKDAIVLDEDDSNMYGKMEYKRIPNEERVSDPIMTYYEIVRIIGTRAQQFNLGAEPLVQGIDHFPPPQMAYIELMAKMTPFIIRRHLPGKKYEDWRIDELEIIHTISDDFFVPGKLDWEHLLTTSSKTLRELRSVLVPQKTEENQSRVVTKKP